MPSPSSRIASLPTISDVDSRPALPLRSVSVVVPCAGWPDTLAACLHSLAAQTVDLPVEIVIVVNGPYPRTAPRSWAGATIVHEPTPGPAAARNAGVCAATGDVLAFTDSDCVADSQWLAAALSALRKCGSRSVIAGAIRRPGARRNPVSLYDSVTFLTQEIYVKSSGAFVTANLVVHRSVFERVGPFDPAFNDAAFEDTDWALRARQAGVPILYEPGAVIDHPCMLRLRELRVKSERLARGEIAFRRKHGQDATAPALHVVLRDHLRPAMRRRDVGALDRLRLGGIAIAAGFWRWRAFRRTLRDDRRGVGDAATRPGAARRVLRRAFDIIQAHARAGRLGAQPPREGSRSPAPSNPADPTSSWTDLRDPETRSRVARRASLVRPTSYGLRRLRGFPQAADCASVDGMIEEDLLRAAQTLLDRYGAQARGHAELHADVLQHDGQPRAALAWRLVMRTIDELGARDRP